ncbi:hypothetical protein EIN_492930 [Entamoeba invadens IP1]|uniref:Uncharacterized protein n=1 Tax=Entamoeba invadens IP1 TaxID=370355 RepID=A0A0A1UA35_ENTIV|nr:hypothetical protein EIN_492930 [Entamoeba invadens IP1]ELP89004.1 hypothetical protein EIN_492930 [Entamoeba invadens IP1]|eukprot:XP_004255775.1 hypothetical protein EIN_492930 [Entamoeba invadens IP1]
MHRHGKAKKKAFPLKSKSVTPEHTPPIKESSPIIRTVVFSGGEIVSDTQQDSISVTPKSREVESENVTNERIAIARTTHDICKLFSEMEKTIKEDERRLINAVMRNHENLTRELQYSFDSGSVVMELPYIPPIKGTDIFLGTIDKNLKDTNTVLTEINDLFVHCAQRVEKIEKSKKDVFEILKKYDDDTLTIINIIKPK